MLDRGGGHGRCRRVAAGEGGAGGGVDGEEAQAAARRAGRRPEVWRRSGRRQAGDGGAAWRHRTVIVVARRREEAKGDVKIFKCLYIYAPPFSPGWSHQPGLKACFWPGQAAGSQAFSRGWWLQPGLKVDLYSRLEPPTATKGGVSFFSVFCFIYSFSFVSELLFALLRVSL